jgi:glycerophosphoryl diester phosphodiesterase
MSHRPPTDRPLVIAHRGASWDEPENTLRAFERAIAVGADFIELDVHAAPDGTPLVAHDPPGAAAVPTLAEVVEATRGRIGLMVELKSPHRYRGRRIVERTLALLGDDDLVLSFERRALERAHALRPRLRIVQHVGFGVSIRAAAAYAWGVGLADERVTSASLAAARRLGLATTVYTVNEAGRMADLLRLGVDGIYSDRPDVLRAEVERLRTDA